MFFRELGNPGTSADLFLKSGSDCKGDSGRYEPTANGNLKYFHGRHPYIICIGSKLVKDEKWEPSYHEKVSIEENVCSVNNSCKLYYGKIFLLRSNMYSINCQNKILSSITFKKTCQMSDAKMDSNMGLDFSIILHGQKLRT